MTIKDEYMNNQCNVRVAGNAIDSSLHYLAPTSWRRRRCCLCVRGRQARCRSQIDQRETFEIVSRKRAAHIVP